MRNTQRLFRALSFSAALVGIASPLFAHAAGGSGSVLSAPASAVPAAACTESKTNIGYTVFENSHVKGSASYTSGSCEPITSVTVVFYKNGHRVDSTAVTRNNIRVGESHAFSARPFACRFSTYANWSTHAQFHFRGGGHREKISNRIRIPCS